MSDNRHYAERLQEEIKKEGTLWIDFIHYIRDNNIRIGKHPVDNIPLTDWQSALIVLAVMAPAIIVITFLLSL